MKNNTENSPSISIRDNVQGKRFEEYQLQRMQWNQLSEDEKNGKDAPILTENVISDITIEKVGYVLQHNRKGAILAADELKGWLNSFCRYTKGNAEQTYLELFTGSPLTVSRISREPVHVPDPYLTIIGTTQPDVLCSACQ